MSVKYNKLLEKYHFQFEGIPDPVFYRTLYPTNIIGEKQQERRDFGLVLKGAFDCKTHVHHIKILDDFLNCVIADNATKKMGIIAIPSSNSTKINCVTKIVQYWKKYNKLSEQTKENISDLTEKFIRSENKSPAHLDGTRNPEDNINTLKFINTNNLNELEVLIVVDDIVTTGSSFTAVKKIIEKTGFNGTVINFAFSRSMNESAHNNYDAWNEVDKRRKNIRKKHKKIDGIIFDFDQTLVDTTERKNDFELNIKNISTKKADLKEAINLKIFLENNSSIYSVYESVHVRTFQQKKIPFAILSNSWLKRIDLLSQMESIQQFIYPEIWKSSHSQDVTDINWVDKFIDKDMYNSYGRPYIYRFKNNCNIFTAHLEMKDTKYYPKPNEQGVYKAKSWLEDEFNLPSESRIIGLGNTMEDIIAYNYAGLESCLALWGVPTFCQKHAELNWGADHVFNSFKDFSAWVDEQETVDKFINLNLDDIIEEFDDGEYIVFEKVCQDSRELKKTKNKLQNLENINILKKFTGQKKADLYILQQFFENVYINNYSNKSINIFTTIEYFPDKLHWQYLDLLSKKINIPITVSTRLDKAYKTNQLNNFDLGNIQTKQKNSNALKILKLWKEEKLEWPGI